MVFRIRRKLISYQNLAQTFILSVLLFIPYIFVCLPPLSLKAPLIMWMIWSLLLLKITLFLIFQSLMWMVFRISSWSLCTNLIISLMFYITPLLLWSKTVKEVGLSSQTSLATLHWKNAWFSVSIYSSQTGHVLSIFTPLLRRLSNTAIPPCAILHQKVFMFGGILRDQIDEQYFLTSSDITAFVSWFPASIVEKFLWI